MLKQSLIIKRSHCSPGPSPHTGLPWQYCEHFAPMPSSRTHLWYQAKGPESLCIPCGNYCPASRENSISFLKGRKKRSSRNWTSHGTAARALLQQCPCCWDNSFESSVVALDLEAEVWLDQRGGSDCDSVSKYCSFTSSQSFSLFFCVQHSLKQFWSY